MSIAAETTRSFAPPCAPPDFLPKKPAIELPKGATDCHAHILGPSSQFAYSPERIYTPPDCSLPSYRDMLNTLGVARAVLVQPSVYGTDNAVLLRALGEGGSAFRGVAVVDWSIDDAALHAMQTAGVRGVRVNVVDVQPGKNAFPLEQLTTLARRVAPLGWHMEFLLHVDQFPTLDDMLENFPVDVVFGHLGYMSTGHGQHAAGFRALRRLLSRGRAWVKLTGPYRISTGAMPHADVTPFAHTLLATAPDKIVWGTDWPHVMVKAAMPNDGDIADLLSTWIPDEELRRKVLVDNPARLYGF